MKRTYILFIRGTCFMLPYRDINPFIHNSQNKNIHSTSVLSNPTPTSVLSISAPTPTLYLPAPQDSNFSDSHLDLKIKKQKIAELKKMVQGGYTEYKDVFELGSLSYLKDKSNLEESVIKFLSSLDDNKVYSLLVIVQEKDPKTDSVIGTINKSLKIHKRIHINRVVDKLYNDYISYASTEYELPEDSKFIIMNREWLNQEEYETLVDKKINVIDILSNELIFGNDDKENGSIYDQIKDRIDLNKFGDYLKVLPYEYGELISDQNNIQKYKINDKEGVKVEKINEYKNQVSLIYFEEEEENNYLSDFENIKWIDTKINKGYQRSFGEMTIFFDNNKKIINFNFGYSFPNLPQKNIEQIYNDKIGTIDFETYKVNDFGTQCIYSGGWATKDECRMVYIGDYNCKDETEIIQYILKDIFNNGKNGYIFYAHNFSKFDSLFLLKCLVSLKPEYKFVSKFKDNGLFYLKITNNISKKSIILLDSKLIFDCSLREVCKNFNTLTYKGVFPYRFMNEENLFYNGSKPSFEYYDDIDEDEWNNLSTTEGKNWNVKIETLKYLKSDLLGLLEALLILSKFMHDKYNANITSYPTLPSLVRGIFLSKFYDYNNNIKIIKGGIEKDIRKAYFAGLNQIFEHEIFNGFMYDMVSQYPASMKNNPFPIGNPTFTINTNLDQIFGFSYCKIIAPEINRLKNLILPIKTKEGVKMGEGLFYGWYCTEELKFARDNGYVIEVICSYTFNANFNNKVIAKLLLT